MRPVQDGFDLTLISKKKRSLLKAQSKMDEFKSVRSGDRQSGRSEIISFESERYFL